jgi:uncharacterized protein (DUF427 family)
MATMNNTQESVWDYPRPPRMEPDTRRVQVEFGGISIADTTQALRVLETSHPPVFYLPGEDVRMEFLFPTQASSWCEFKGRATYWTVEVEARRADDAVWGYPQPTQGYESLAGHFAFYPSKMDRCSVGGVPVSAQEGDFYGGWITPEITGPFKGGPGTRGW